MFFFSLLRDGYLLTQRLYAFIIVKHRSVLLLFSDEFKMNVMSYIKYLSNLFLSLTVFAVMVCNPNFSFNLFD